MPRHPSAWRICVSKRLLIVGRPIPIARHRSSGMCPRASPEPSFGSVRSLPGWLGVRTSCQHTPACSMPGGSIIEATATRRAGRLPALGSIHRRGARRSVLSRPLQHRSTLAASCACQSVLSAASHRAGLPLAASDWSTSICWRALRAARLRKPGRPRPAGACLPTGKRGSTRAPQVGREMAQDSPARTLQVWISPLPPRPGMRSGGHPFSACEPGSITAALPDCDPLASCDRIARRAGHACPRANAAPPASPSRDAPWRRTALPAPRVRITPLAVPPGTSPGPHPFSICERGSLVPGLWPTSGPPRATGSRWPRRPLALPPDPSALPESCSPRRCSGPAQQGRCVRRAGGPRKLVERRSWSAPPAAAEGHPSCPRPRAQAGETAWVVW